MNYLMNMLWTRPTRVDAPTLWRSAVAEEVFPNPTLKNFFDYAFEGFLPDGRTSVLPLMRQDEVELLSQPYSSWAGLPDQNASVLDKTIQTSAALHMEYPRMIHPLKTQLWMGMTPLSDLRWKQKHLDKPENVQGLFEYVNNIVKVFGFWNLAPVQESFQKSFKMLEDDFVQFQDLLNQRRHTNGITPDIDMVALWREYIRVLFTTISDRAHSWVLEKALYLQEASKTAWSQADPALISSYNASKLFIERAQDLNKLLSAADWQIAMPLPYSSTDGDPDNHLDQPATDREKLYYGIADSLEWPAMASMLENKDKDTGGFTDKDAVLAVFEEGQTHRTTVRQELRGKAPVIAEEFWITVLLSRINWSLSHGGPDNQTWGFVAYRLTYEESDERWAQFLKKLEEVLHASGQGVPGAEKVRDRAGFQWLDGRDFDIAENDIDGARRHFATFRHSDSKWKRMWMGDFVVFDKASLDSHFQEHSSELTPYGSRGPHLLLIDGSGNLSRDNELLGPQIPEFKGVVKVLTCLILDNVYPLITAPALRPRDFWALSQLHPDGLYVGS